MTPKLEAKVESLFIGRIQTPWPDKAPSAINKSSVSGPLQLTLTGFIGDEQADPRYHGGPDKAVHHYAADHYPYWVEQNGENSKFHPGGFGENISTTGLTEDLVCIGDVFTLGETRLQISQGRQPCWKLNAHSGIENLSHEVMQTKFTGWYYRVLEEGIVSPGDSLQLVERSHWEWTVRRVTEARFSPRSYAKFAVELASLSVLSESWRETFSKLL